MSESVIYTSKYISRSYNESKNMLISTWKVTTEELDDSGFKEEMLKLTEHLMKYKVFFLLTLSNDLRFTISVELQNWILNDIVPKLKSSNLKKQAMVVPQEFFAKLSVEQTLQDIKTSSNPVTKMFPNKEEALGWLERLED